MDAIKNPFSPGAGSPPPELVGHEGILEQARILLGRIKARRPEKSILLTGLRGVGKTVLLNEIERMAAQTGYRTLSAEAHEDKSLAALLVPPLRKLLFELDRVAGAGNWSGPGPQRSSDIADALGVTVNGLGPVRSKLIKKGMIYSPAHGDLAFTVPLFNEFMLRAVPKLD